MKRERGSALLALATLVALVALVATGCGSDEQESSALEPPSGAPSEGMKGIRLQNLKVGDTRWALQADTASVYREKKRIVAEVVEIDFYEADEHVSTLTADQGILLQATDDLEVRGNVRVVTQDGAVLKTRVLFWDHQGSKIHTDAFVEITRGEDVLTGVGMEADPGLDRIEIKEEVRGETHGDEGLADETGGERR
jgi:LPS export ABC transporter protein LptC